jgi:hypothetical protein
MPAASETDVAAGGRWFRRRSVPFPTWRSWLLAGCAVAAAAIGFGLGLPHFLAVTARVPGAEVLVVEAWGPDFVVEAAWEEYRRGGYRQLVVAGGPMERGEALSEYRSYAELGRATLLRLGAPGDAVAAAPGPKAARDRTLVSAQAVRAWLGERGAVPPSICVMTPGAHARRTRLAYERAFGPGVAVGIVAVPEERYEARNWWRSSAGVKTELLEFIGYAYVRLFGW